MSKDKFEKEFVDAVLKYGEDSVDIILKGNKVYGTYHSQTNSFNVTEEYLLKDIGGHNTVDGLLDKFPDVGIEKE